MASWFAKVAFTPSSRSTYARARRVRLAAKFFADCTGDGTVGFLAGADYEVSKESIMGASNLWNVMDLATRRRCC